MDRMVRYARFTLNANAFIFVADPLRISPLFEKLRAPERTQKVLQQQLGVIHGFYERKISENLNDVLAEFERYQGYMPGSSLSNIPIAIMLSKVDLLKYVSDAKSYTFMVNPHYRGDLDLQDVGQVDRDVRAFLKEYKQGDLLATTRIFKRASFFASSATGEPFDATGHYKQVTPRRCLDPVLWILYQLGVIPASI